MQKQWGKGEKGKAEKLPGQLRHHSLMDSSLTLPSSSFINVGSIGCPVLLSFLGDTSSKYADSPAYYLFCYCSITQLCLTLCHPVDCSTPGFPILHHLPEFAQTHVYWVDDAIQPSHPLLSPSPPALNLSQHQGLYLFYINLFTGCLLEKSATQSDQKWIPCFPTIFSFKPNSDGPWQAYVAECQK